MLRLLGGRQLPHHFLKVFMGMNEEIDWNHWLGENSARLMLYARQQCRVEADAEDALQESLVQLVRTVESGDFRGGPERWLSYVYTAIRHNAMDRGRRMDVRSNYEQAVQESDSELGLENPWLSCASDDEVLRQQVEELLRSIKPDFAEIIVLKIWGERTFQDIADVIGISISTVVSRYRYGMEELRKAFAASGIER